MAADAGVAIRTVFTKNYIAALRSKDPAQVKAFLHPKVRACINDRTKEYFDFLLAHEAELNVNGNYKVTGVETHTGPAPLFGMPDDGFYYPVQPTHEVQIQFDQGNTVLIRLLAEDRGSWYEVFPCPTDKGMAFMREQMRERDEQQKKIAQLASELKDPLLAELKDLVKQQRIFDAVKKYQESTGADLTTSRMVVRVLEQQH
jgi:hypothetical protein